MSKFEKLRVAFSLLPVMSYELDAQIFLQNNRTNVYINQYIWYNIYMEKDIFNIDKNKLNLCFLTEYLIDWNFIKLNDINLFSYDNFLTNLLNEGKYTYDEIMKVVAYVATRIMKNNYLDENKQPINSLLSYFKTSCISNLGMNERIDEWLKEVGMI